MVEVLLVLTQLMVAGVMDDYNKKKHPQEVLWNIAGIIAEESHAAGVDPIMVTAIAYAESKFVTMAVSKSGCCGVMQVNPRFSTYDCKQLQDPRVGIKDGIRVIVRLKQRFGKKWLCHYNVGNVCDDATHSYSRYVRWLYKKMRRSIKKAQYSTSPLA